MAINGTVVLAIGIMSVLGVAVRNNHRANAASPPVAAVVTASAFHGSTSSAPELPRGYLTNPATSPLAGVGAIVLPPARPILRADAYLVVPVVRSDMAFPDDGRRPAFN
jgi:hypothetical protein